MYEMGMKLGSTRSRVLVVDDDVPMLRLMSALLSVDSDVTSCSSGERALCALAQHEFSVVCSDFRMPGMDGAQLLRKVAEVSPSSGRLLVTGADYYTPPESRRSYYVLLKPFDPERLVQIVRQLACLARMRSWLHAMSAPTERRIE